MILLKVFLFPYFLQLTYEVVSKSLGGGVLLFLEGFKKLEHLIYLDDEGEKINSK